MDTYDLALELEPRNVQTLTAKASTLKSMGRHKEAKDCNDLAYGMDQNFFLEMAIASAQHGIGDVQDAVYWLDRFIDNNPESVIAYLNKALAVERLGNKEEGLNLLDSALALGTNNKDLFINRKYTITLDQSQLRELDSGNISFDQILSRKSLDFQIHFHKGRIFNELGRYEEAINSFDFATEVDPSLAEAYYNKGVAYGHLQRFDAALFCFDKVLEILSKHVDAQKNKGYCLLRLNRPEEALQIFDRILETDTNDVYAIVNKAIALNDIGKHRDSIKWFDKALEIEPNAIDILNNKARALYAIGKYHEVLKCYDKALEIDPNEIFILMNKSQVFYNLGQYQESINNIERALAINPDNPKLLEIKKKIHESLK